MLGELSRRSFQPELGQQRDRLTTGVLRSSYEPRAEQPGRPLRADASCGFGMVGDEPSERPGREAEQVRVAQRLDGHGARPVR